MIPATTALDPHEIGAILAAGLGTRSAATREAYRIALQQFAAFSGAADPEDAFRGLLAAGPAAASMKVLRWQSSMVASGLSAATVNARVAGIRAMVRVFAPILGWRLEIPSLRARGIRDVRGPTVGQFREILAALEYHDDPRVAARTRLALRLASDLSFRVREIAEIRWSDLESDGSDLRVWTRRKAHTHRSAWTATIAVRDALEAWERVDGEHGPSDLVIGVSARQLKRDFAAAGRAAGVSRCRSNQIRHLSNTLAVEALDRLGLSLDEGRQHTGHASISTLLLYRDQGAGIQSRISEAVSSAIDAD
jgi:integrase